MGILHWIVCVAANAPCIIARNREAAMQTRLIVRKCLITAGASLVFLSVTTPLFAQPWWSKVPAANLPRTPDGKVNLAAPAPRLPDGKPDFSGVWNPPLGYIRDLANGVKEPVPFQAWAKAEYDVRASGAKWREEPDANCLPQG